MFSNSGANLKVIIIIYYFSYQLPVVSLLRNTECAQKFWVKYHSKKTTF